MPNLRINNYNFYYEVYGKGDPIIFIHGLGSSTLDWENQIPFFAQKYKVIVLDLRGHGNTGSVNGEYSINLFAADVAQLITLLDVSSVHIVGISMGGMVGFQLVIDFPNLIKSLVVINSFVEIDLSISKNRRQLKLRKLIPRLLGMKIMGKIIGKKLFPDERQAHLRQMIAERWKENSVEDYLKTVKAIEKWSGKNRLSEINCPVLVVASEFDYTSIEEKAIYTKAMSFAEMVIIENSRHGVVFDQPDKLNQVIFDFLNLIGNL